MIAVLEVHDSTGWSEQSTAVNISNAVQYWTSSDVRAAINGQENFVIINIANEPFGNNTTASYFPQTRGRHHRAAQRGPHAQHHDRRGQLGPGLVQRRCATTPWSCGTRTRCATSRSACTCTRCTSRSRRSGVHAGLRRHGPAAGHRRIRPGEQRPARGRESVISQAQQRGNGYLGWSWSGNGGCGAGLDMTNNFDARRSRPGAMDHQRHQRHPRDIGARDRVRTGGQQSHGLADVAVVRLRRVLCAGDRHRERRAGPPPTIRAGSASRPRRTPATAASP